MAGGGREHGHLLDLRLLAGVGFAIPSDTADQVTRQLISGGRITRGYLGATVGDVDRDIAESQGLREARGAFINEVVPNGPASRAGLQSGDIVLSVNGQPVGDANDLTRAVAATRRARRSAWRSPAVTAGGPST
jgi:serine protease Do